MKNLTKAEEELYFWQMGTCGGFQMKLFELICKADAQNQQKLALGFPDEVKAIQRFQTESGYWESIRKAMGN